MKFVFLILGLFLFVSCSVPKSTPELEAEKSQISLVLNDWHLAAADADFDRYFNYMADSSIFIGTDASEYWNKSEFMTYSKPHFDKGKAWSFKASTRHIYIDQFSEFAWFDEELVTQNMGACRGTGILKKINSEWKISHYTLSLSIPNDMVGKVVKDIETFHAK